MIVNKSPKSDTIIEIGLVTMLQVIDYLQIERNPLCSMKSSRKLSPLVNLNHFSVSNTSVGISHWSGSD